MTQKAPRTCRVSLGHPREAEVAHEGAAGGGVHQEREAAHAYRVSHQ